MDKRVWNRIDMTGKKFNRLTVISEARELEPEKKTSNYRPKWHCICDCGTECVKEGNLLRSGNIKSCGCIRGNELSGKMSSANEVMCLTGYRDLKGKMTIQEFYELITSPCHYCGREPDKWQGEGGSANRRKMRFTKPGGYFLYHGLDRKINSLGHVPGNVVPCCWKCNDFKSAMDYDEFLDHMCDIINHVLGSSETGHGGDIGSGSGMAEDDANRAHDASIGQTIQLPAKQR